MTVTQVKSGTFGNFVEKELITDDTVMSFNSDSVPFGSASTDIVPLVYGLTIEAMEEIDEGAELYIGISNTSLDFASAIPASELTCIDASTHKYAVESKGKGDNSWVIDDPLRVYQYLYLGGSGIFSLVLFDMSAQRIYKTKIKWKEMEYDTITSEYSYSKDDFTYDESASSVVYVSNNFNNSIIGEIVNESTVTENVGLMMCIEDTSMVGYTIQTIEDAINNMLANSSSTSQHLTMPDYYRTIVSSYYPNATIVLTYVDLSKCTLTSDGYYVTSTDAILATRGFVTTKLSEVYPIMKVESADELAEYIIKPLYDFNVEYLNWPFLWSEDESIGFLSPNSLVRKNEGWAWTEEGKKMVNDFLSVHENVYLSHNILQGYLLGNRNTSIEESGIKSFSLPMIFEKVEFDGEFPVQLDVHGKIGTAVNFIPSEGFKNTCLDTVMIPNGIETIESKAFDGCSKMLHAWLPETTKTIQDYAFRGSIKRQSCFGINNVTSEGKGIFDE